MTRLGPYPEYRTSDVPWVERVPGGWRTLPLYAVMQESKRPNLGVGESNLLSLSFGRIVRKDIESNDGLLPASFETYQIVEPGDLVFRFTDLQNDKRSLRSALVGERGIITSAYAAATPRRVSPDYAAYLMRAYDTTKVFYGLGGGVRQSLKFSDVRRLPVLVPPLPEQRAISHYLDRETAKIDALCAKQERLIARLRERRSAVVDTFALRGLHPHPTGADFSVRAPAFVGNHRAVESALGHLPRGWAVLRFKAALRRVEERNVGATHTMMSLRSTGEVVPRASLGERQEPDPRNIPRYLVARQGDLVVNPMWLIGGAIGVSEVVGAVSPDYRVFRSHGQHYPRYLHHLLRSRPYVDQYRLYTRANTTFDRRVQQPDLNNLPLPLPPLREQRDIAHEIDRQAAKIDQLIVKAQRFIELAKERRTALIIAVVTGQIDVRDAA